MYFSNRVCISPVKATRLFGFEAVRLLLQALLGFLYLQVPLWRHTPLCSPWALFYLDLLCPPADTTAASGTRLANMLNPLTSKVKSYSFSSWSGKVKSRSPVVSLRKSKHTVNRRSHYWSWLRYRTELLVQGVQGLLLIQDLRSFPQYPATTGVTLKARILLCYRLSRVCHQGWFGS